MCLRCESNDVHKALVFTATYNEAFNIGPWIEGVEVMHRAGVVITEVPIDFLDRFSGQSKIPKNQIYLSMLALTRLSFNRLKARG